MKLYGGIDLHSNNSVVALSDEEDRIVFRRRLANEGSEVLAALAPYGDAIDGLVVESTYNWYWLVDALRQRPATGSIWPTRPQSYNTAA